jgi:hypothetical protein
VLLCPRILASKRIPPLMQPKHKTRPGRPSFHPTENHRRLARFLAAKGIPQDRIARIIGISPKTLRKHLRRELTLALLKLTWQSSRPCTKWPLPENASILLPPSFGRKRAAASNRLIPHSLLYIFIGGKNPPRRPQYDSPAQPPRGYHYHGSFHPRCFDERTPPHR